MSSFEPQLENQSTAASVDGGLSAAEMNVNCIFLAFISIVTVAGNALIIVAFVRNERLRTVSNKFVVSLALSDLLVGAISVPIWMYLSLSRWKVPNNISSFFDVIDVLSATASMLHFTCISIERYVALSRPFYHQSLSHCVYHLIIAGLWILSTSLSVLKLLIRETYPLSRLIFVFVLSVGSFLIISLMNIGVYKIAKRLIHSTPGCSDTTGQAFEMQRFARQERKVAVTLAIIAGIFFITWLPQMAVSLTYNLCKYPCNLSRSEEQWLSVFVKWMQFINSAVNPVVFAFRDVEMRQTFAKILRPLKKITACCTKTRVEPAERAGEVYLSALNL